MSNCKKDCPCNKYCAKCDYEAFKANQPAVLPSDEAPQKAFKEGWELARPKSVLADDALAERILDFASTGDLSKADLLRWLANHRQAHQAAPVLDFDKIAKALISRMQDMAYLSGRDFDTRAGFVADFLRTALESTPKATTDHNYKAFQCVWDAAMDLDLIQDGDIPTGHDVSKETPEQSAEALVKVLQRAASAPKATPDAVECAREIVIPPIPNGSHMDEVHNEIYERNVREAAQHITAYGAAVSAEARDKALEEACEAILKKHWEAITDKYVETIRALKGREGV